MRILLSYIFFIIGFSLGFSQDFPNYIAHGCGAIEGNTYTNSKEAFLQSIERGYKFIEVDLSITNDSEVVAVHDWQFFNSITGYENLGDSIPSLSDFRQRIIYKKYTPITIAEIVEILQNYPTVQLVTDKISDFDIIDKCLSSIKERVFVECFTIEDYIKLKEEGYNAMYSYYAENFIQIVIEHLVLGDVRIDFIVNSTSDNFKEVNRLNCLIPLRIATYTVNSEDFTNEHLGKDVDLIYTDFYNPITGQFEGQ